MNQQKTKSGGAKAPSKPKLTPDQIAAKQAAAAEKARKAKEEREAKEKKRQEELKSDQAWLDETLKNKTDAQKYDYFAQASRYCKETTFKDGKITLACPLSEKFTYCVEADKFDCPNGKNKGVEGCRISQEALKALNQGKIQIDGDFMFKAEGGSYLSPYVPWGPMAKKSGGKPKLTSGNKSGVTIGNGVDLGQVSPATYLKDLEKAGVSQATRDKLAPFLGKQKEDACQALREAKSKLNGQPFLIPQDDVNKIDYHSFSSRVNELKGKFDNFKKNHVQNLKDAIALENKKQPPDAAKIKSLQDQVASSRDFESLSPTEQTIVYSTFYHQGAGGIGSAVKQNGKFVTTPKPITTAMISGDKNLIEGALQGKVASKERLIKERGERELKYLKEHLN